MALTVVPQGVLNLLITSITWTDFPQLNVTAPYMLREGMTLNFEGNSTIYIDTMTGAVTSQEPYLKVSTEIQLNKAGPLANQYKTQLETNALLGELTLLTDSPVIDPYTFETASIQNIRALRLNGQDAGFGVTIGAIYQVNSNLWNVL